jgi:hypothetical protein
VSPSKRERKLAKVQGGNERTANFEIRPGIEWDIVVGKDRDPRDSAVPAPSSPAGTNNGNHAGGWLGLPSAAPAAEAILASLMRRVQKLEEAVQRLEAQLADRPDAQSGPRAVG